VHFSARTAWVALSTVCFACASSVTPDAATEDTATEPEEICHTLAIEPTLETAPLAVACTVPSGLPPVTTPCNSEAMLRRELSTDGSSHVFITGSADSSGWNVELELSPDGCAKVRRVPFPDIGEPEPTLATRATIDVSVIPTTQAELDAMAGQFEARFDDGVRFLAQF